MLQPKKTKFRKQQRGRMRGQSSAGIFLEFGVWGLQAQEPFWITSRQIESARRSIVRRTRRIGKLWIRVFPDKPITARVAESRMGSGKGALDYWVATVRKGDILFELSDMDQSIALEALRAASFKFSIRTKIIYKPSAVAGKK